MFSRPDFIEKLKLFVPVYLDGDDPGAQKWGERFGVSGYPTVLVLRADQSELARISGGMDLSQYAEVLDTVLGDVRPVNTILAALKKGRPGPLSRDDCHRLAYYGWDLTDDVNTRFAALARTLSQAAERCPAGSESDRARLILSAAALAADGESDALAAGKPADRQLVQLIGEVNAILKNTSQAKELADAVAGLDDSFFQAVAKVAPQDTAAWNQRFGAIMDGPPLIHASRRPITCTSSIRSLPRPRRWTRSTGFRPNSQRRPISASMRPWPRSSTSTPVPAS